MARLYAVMRRKKRARVGEEPQPQEAEVGDDVFAQENEDVTKEGEGGGEGGENQGESTVEDEKKADEAIDRMPGIPIAVGIQESRKKPGVIFVLERACLEVGKVGKTFQILNSDDHANFLKKQNRNPADYRPDITHQAILVILDSPLAKAGRLQALYVKTEKGVLFEIKPHVRIPRTFKRFCGLMLQLLQKLSITAVKKREKLLNVIKNPITRHLPVNSRRIGLSYSSPKVVQLLDYVAASSDDANLVFVVGAMAHGKISNDYTDDFISKKPLGRKETSWGQMIALLTECPSVGHVIVVIKHFPDQNPLTVVHEFLEKATSKRVSSKLESQLALVVSNYQLSAACCLGRICNALGQKWGIL